MTTFESAAEISDGSQLKLGEILILGGGAVVRECFLPALQQLRLVTRTTVVESSSAANSNWVIRPHIVRKDFRDFIQQVDSQRYSHCIVALPNVYHYDAVREGLRCGLHVLCEKPLALQSKLCLELAAIAEAKGRVLAVNMVRRRFGSIQTASEILRRGWLGELRSLHISHGGIYSWPVMSLAPFQPSNGGILADMGVHYLDIAELYAGNLTPVGYEDDHAGGVESECRYTLRGDSGATVEILLSRIRRLGNSIRLVGSSGTITIDIDQFDSCVFAPNDGGTKCMLVAGTEHQGRSFEDYFTEQLRCFLRAEIGATNGLVNARAAARATSLIEWAYDRRQAVRAVGSSPNTPKVVGRVLVTGATGFIGSHLVGRLNRDGAVEIVAAYRHVQACAAISKYAVQYDQTDLLDRENVRRALRGTRYVFHLAYGRESGDAQAVTVEGTKNVVEAAIIEKVEAVVILSTMYVLGRPDGIVDEASGYRPIGGIYGKTKTEMERWCLNRAKSSGKTRIIVLLPTCVYGPRGRAYTEIPVSLAREGGFCWIENGSGTANVTYVENLVEAMIRAALTSEAHGQRFIINDECLTWREFLSPFVAPWLESIPSFDAQSLHRLAVRSKAASLADVFRSALSSREVSETLKRTQMANHLRPLVRKWAPFVAARLRQIAATRVEVSGERPPSPPPAWLAELFAASTTRFSSEKARKELGWTPVVDRETARRQTIEWLSGVGLR